MRNGQKYSRHQYLLAAATLIKGVYHWIYFMTEVSWQISMKCHAAQRLYYISVWSPFEKENALATTAASLSAEKLGYTEEISHE